MGLLAREVDARAQLVRSGAQREQRQLSILSMLKRQSLPLETPGSDDASAAW